MIPILILLLLLSSCSPQIETPAIPIQEVTELPTAPKYWLEEADSPGICSVGENGDCPYGETRQIHCPACSDLVSESFPLGVSDILTSDGRKMIDHAMQSVGPACKNSDTGWVHLYVVPSVQGSYFWEDGPEDMMCSNPVSIDGREEAACYCDRLLYLEQDHHEECLPCNEMKYQEDRDNYQACWAGSVNNGGCGEGKRPDIACRECDKEEMPYCKGTCEGCWPSEFGWTVNKFDDGDELDSCDAENECYCDLAKYTKSGERNCRECIPMVQSKPEDMIVSTPSAIVGEFNPNTPEILGKVNQALFALHRHDLMHRGCMMFKIQEGALSEYVTAAHCISEPVTTSFPIIELNLVHPKEQGAPVQAWHYENPVPGGAINNECLEYEQDPYRNPVASNGFWEHWNSNDGSNACMMANFGVSPAPYSDGTDPRFDFGFFFEQILAYKSMEDIFVHEEGTYDYIAWKGDAISQSLDVATLKPFSWSVVSTKGVENMLLNSRFSWNLYRQAEIDYLSSNPESAYARFLSRLHAYKGLRPVPFNIKIEDSPKFYIPISKTGEKDGIFDKPPFPGFAYELSLLDCEKEFQPPHEQIFSHYVYVNPGKSGEFPFTQQDQNIVTKEDTLWCKPDNIMEKGGMSGSPVIYFLPGSNEPYVAGVFTMGYGTQQKDIWNGFSDPAITSQFFRLKLLG